MASSGIPGMAVAVVADGKLVFAKGYGVRSVLTQAPVDADTVFQLASLSKPIGATVVARQVGRGVVQWETPVSRWLPGFRLADPFVTTHVTVGDLYAHRSGLPDHAGDYLEQMGYRGDDMLKRLRYFPLAPFRISYAYTNFGLTAGAQAVARASYTDWATLSDTALYQPLGMRATSSRYADFLKRADRATAHIKTARGFEVTPDYPADAQSPAGGVTSSVNDMARWMQMVLAQGCVDGQPLIDAKALLPALTPQIVSGAPHTPEARSGFYGYGFNVSDSAAGRVVLGHSGGFRGNATAFSLLPSAQVGIITLTNAQPMGVPEILNAEFLDLVQFGQVAQDWNRLYTEAVAPMAEAQGALAGKTPPADARPPQALSRYTGHYDSPLWGRADVTLVGGQLQLALGPYAIRAPLSHWDGVNASIAVTPILAGQFDDGSSQRCLIGAWLGSITNRGTGEMERPADTPFSVTQAHSDMGHGLAATCRAQKFPRLTSRSIWLSMTASDSARRKRAFSCSSSFSRLAWSIFRPPYSLRQRK